MMILAIFLLNYFDKLYIRGCIVALVTSLVLDFFWVIGLSTVRIFLFRITGMQVRVIVLRLELASCVT